MLTMKREQLVKEGFSAEMIDCLSQYSKEIGDDLRKTILVTPQDIASDIIGNALDFFAVSIDIRGNKFLNAIKFHRQHDVISGGRWKDSKFTVIQSLTVQEQSCIDLMQQIEITDEVIENLEKLGEIIPNLQVLVSNDCFNILFTKLSKRIETAKDFIDVLEEFFKTSAKKNGCTACVFIELEVGKMNSKLPKTGCLINGKYQEIPFDPNDDCLLAISKIRLEPKMVDQIIKIAPRNLGITSAKSQFKITYCG